MPKPVRRRRRVTRQVGRSAPETHDEVETPAAKRPAPAWFVIGFVALVLGCCGFFYFKSQADEGKPDDLGAQTVCQTFVERGLKAPSTARFSGESVTSNGTTWTVRGSVDAENSFGARLRMNYVCTVRPADAAGDNWTLVSLTGLD